MHLFTTWPQASLTLPCLFESRHPRIEAICSCDWKHFLWQQHPPLPSDALYWFEQCLTAVIQRATPSCYLGNKKVLNPSLFQLFRWERELRNTKGLVRKVNKRERQKGNNVEPAALSPLTLPWLRSRTLSTVGSTRALFFRGGCGVSPLLVPSPGPGAEKQKVIPVDQRLCCKNTNN